MLMRFSVLLLACLALSAQDQPIGRGVNFYGKEKEAALGAQLAGEVRQKTTALDSAAAHDYLARLGARLIAQIPDTGFAFTFTVAADGADISTHEPLALPGGYIFVPGSLFFAAQDEAEFAGMLAHSIAHVAARHGTRQATRGEIVSIASVPLIFMGGWTGFAMQQGAATAVPLGFLRFQRTLELEADRLAIGMMAGAGCDPDALVRYIGRVQPPPDQTTSKLFSPLPERDERVAAMRQAIQELPPRAYSPGKEFPPIQDEVRRLTPNPAPRAPSLIRPQ